MAINVPLNAQLQNATQLQQQIQNAVNSVRLNIGGAGGARALNSLSQPLGRLTGQADEFTKSLDAANARVLAFGASVGVVNALSNAFKQLVVATIDVEKTLADINVIFGKSGSEIKNFGKGIFDVAKQTGQSFQAVSKAALEFARQGLGVEDTLKRTNDALVLTRLTGLDTEKAVAGLTATINGFAKEALTTAQVVNSLAAVDQKFAVSAADLIDALNRSAGVAENAGVGFNELVGIVTALQERTARGGAVIGNAIKTIFTRIQRPEVLAQLQGLGVAVEDFNTGKLLSASEILKNLAGNVQALGEIQRAGVFEDVAGGFQINQLIALLNDLSGARSKAAEATKISTEATNQAYVANEQLNKTISALVNQTVEGLRELGATLGNLGLSDNIKSLLGVVNGFIDDVQTLFEGEGIGSKFAAGIVKGLGSVLSGPGLALFGVIISKLLIDLGKFAVQGLKTFLGIGKAAADQKALQDSIVQTLLRNEGAQRAILSLQGNQIAQASVLAGIFNQQQAALTNIQRTAAGIAPTLFQAGLRGGPGGLRQAGRAAGGYLPAAEASDVRRGVGGAPSNAQVVSIPNFAFGGGKRGTMIANTSEYIVPNFAGGGSAIFNQDMVRSMGLPKGAKKIRAAGGYIPNFASTNPVQISANALGGIGMITLDPLGDKQQVKTSGEIKASESSKFASLYPNISSLKVTDLVVSTAIPGLNANRQQGQSLLPQFEQKINDVLLEPFLKFTSELFGDEASALLGPDFSVSNYANALKRELKGQSFLSKSAQGAIFEKAIAVGLNSYKGIAGLAGIFGADENAPFDFDASGPIPERTKGAFFPGTNIFKADAKRTNNTESRRSLVKKIINDPVTSKGLNSILKIYGGAPKAKASGGYIPNFAASALQEAIAREQAQSGLQPNQISVTRDPRLVNASNPNGLAVVNNRDEPNGRVPNFAKRNYPTRSRSSTATATTATATTATATNAGGANNGDQEPEVAKGFGDLAGKIFLAQSALAFFNGALGDASSSTAKIFQAFTNLAGNVGSLGFIFSELKGFKPTSVLGTVGKSLGMAGLAIGVATEVFSFANEAVKEFSGENARAATESAKLADATSKLSLKFENLSKTRQEEIKQRSSNLLGEAGFQSFFGKITSNIFGTKKDAGGDIGGNVDVQKAVADLQALGASQEEISDILKSSKKIVTENRYVSAGLGATTKVSVEIDETQASDVIKTLNQEISSGLGKSLNESYKKFVSDTKNINISTPKGRSEFLKTAAKSYGAEDFQSLPKAKQDVIKEELKTRIEINKTRTDEIKQEKNLALGEKISIDLAKERLNTLFEQKQAAIELSEYNGTDALRFEMELSTTTKARTIEIQKQLEYAKLEAQYQKDSLAALKQGVDKLIELPDENILGIPAEKIDAIREGLQGLTDDQLKNLKTALDKVNEQGGFGLKPQQIESLKGFLEESTKKAKDAKDAGEEKADAEAAFGVKVLNANAALQGQLSLVNQIVEKTQATGNLNISSNNLTKSQNQSAINRLRALASSPENTEAQKQDFEKRAIALEKLNNNIEQNNLLENKRIALSKLRGEIDKNQNELATLTNQTDTTSINRKNELNNAIENLNLQIQTEENNYKSASEAIRSNNEVLDIQAKNIGKVAGAYQSLQQQLESFKLGAAGRIAGANLNILGSTDANSMAKSAIASQVEQQAQRMNLNNKQYYEFVTKTLALREKEFDISVETSAVRRLEMERELELMKKISQISAKTDEERLVKIKQILAESKKVNQSFSGGLSSGLSQLQTDVDNFSKNFGEELPQLFSQNLAQAFTDAVSGAKKLKDALIDAGKSFLQSLSERLIKNAVDRLTLSLFGAFGFSEGGSVSKFASGGKIIGGSGVKDDVPAMLTGGEYVIKKSAVKKYGSSFFDSLNNGRIQKFASGGQVLNNQTGAEGFSIPGIGSGAITGSQSLLNFATQSFTSGSRDFGSLFGDSGASINLEPESVRLSSIGRENSPMFEAIQQAKSEAFDIYKEGESRKDDYLKLLKQYKDDEKQKKDQLENSIKSAAILLGISTLGTSFLQGFSNAFKASRASGSGRFISGLKGFGGGFGFGGSTGLGGLGNLFSGNFSSAYASATPGGIGGVKGGQYKFANQAYGPGGMGPPKPSAPIGFQPSEGQYIPYKRQSGGYIMGGSGLKDDVPAMLSGGEFVLNNRATKNIGLQKLNALNNSSQINQSDSQASSELMGALITKLDELIQVTGQSSSKDNVIVNVSGADSENSQEKTSEKNRELQNKIKQAVLDILAQEKRLGGSLSNR